MYTYENLLDDVNYLAKTGVETGSIGQSESGLMIPYIKLGGGKVQKNIIVTGAIHAREHMCAELIIKQIFYLVKEGLPKEGSVYFVPMVNPDGNIIAVSGAEHLKKISKSFDFNFLEDLKGADGDYALFKANARGVDLNTNFDADWGGGKQNVFTPAFQNYVGPRPFSEKESAALRDFTLKINPSATVSYHAAGDEIYWFFYQDKADADRDKEILQKINAVLNYKIIEDAAGSAGGYKDWCIQKLKIPSFTIEIFPPDSVHPITDYAPLKQEFEKNKTIPGILLDCL